MKLASLKKGGRDGTLVVVSRNLERAVEVPEIAASLRHAIEDWRRCAPRLADVSGALERGERVDARPLRFDELAAPLPRAFQWLDGSAYLNHAELVRKARNAAIPESMYREPMIYQGGSDSFLGPRDDILIADEKWGIDLEAEIAVVTDDVPMGVTAEEAAAHIQLLLLVNDVSLRNLMPDELAKGFGFLTSKPSTAFSPVAVTPDELGTAWNGRKLSLTLESRVDNAVLGTPNTGTDLDFDFPQLIAFAAMTRELRAGTIVGSGTVSNRDASAGSSCIQERRMLEKLATGTMSSPHLRFGNVVRIAAIDAAGDTPFGAIEQRVVRYERRAPS